jgi:hypothetical protein
MFDTTAPQWQEPNNQSLSDLIASYRLASRYTFLRARTRRDYDQVLDYLNGTIGHVAIASIKRPQVIAQMEANAHRTRFANYIQQVLSVLFEHAIDLGWLDHNPAKSVRKLKTPAERRAPHRPWTDEAIATFRARADLNRPADLRAWDRQRAAPRRLAEVPLVRLRRRGAPHHARQNRGQPLAALFARAEAHA